MDESITVEIKHEYGTKRIYPLLPNAKYIRMLTGRTTLTERDVSALGALGFKFIVKTPEI